MTIYRTDQSPQHFIVVFNEQTTSRLVLWLTIVEMIETSNCEPCFPVIEAWLDEALKP